MAEVTAEQRPDERKTGALGSMGPDVQRWELSRWGRLGPGHLEGAAGGTLGIVQGKRLRACPARAHTPAVGGGVKNTQVRVSPCVR